MRSGTWNVRSLYRSVSFTAAAAAARELPRYKLDLVVGWDKGKKVRPGDYKFFYGQGKKIINWEQDFCTPQSSISS